MVDQLLSVVAPHSCCGCGNPGLILCDSCKNDIICEPFSACLVCLHPTIDDNLCKTCRHKTGVERGWCVGAREASLKYLLDRYKFDSAKEAGRKCVELLQQRLPLLPEDLVIVPVPTSPTHRRLRGFDHTLYLARILAAQRKLAWSQLLIRRDNETQHFKNRVERLKHPTKSLEVRGRVPQSVLLVDDIYTTGATLGACVQKMREAGVKRIFVAIIARQTLDEMSDLW